MRFYFRLYIILPLNNSGLQKALGIILMTINTLCSQCGQAGARNTLFYYSSQSEVTLSETTANN